MGNSPDPERMAAGVVTAPDGRRPGRIGYRSPYLIGLLRRDWQTAELAHSRETNNARQAQPKHERGGFGIAMLIGLALWAAIAASVWLLWRSIG